MAGSNFMYIALAFLAGVVLGNKVKELVSSNLGFDIPSFYASYPAGVDYPATTATTLSASVDGSSYDSALERTINHIPID